MGPRRAAVLIGVHVLIALHVLHWYYSGRTLSPVEPSEAMYTLNQGYLNAGFIFFATAILSCAIFGRFVCGWACHLVAYQDLCAWMLKKVGIKPKPFRSRLPLLAPLALAIYMFVWPSAYRMGWYAYGWATDRPVRAGVRWPGLSNHIATSDFWATFPGPVGAIITIAVCGFLVVYVLGAKGFCTYACPYGGFFAPVDKIARGRIRVTDACEHCGHCTAVCTSNVRVHEEVALYGMVVDPGCMKCMDGVSVCPNDALYFGWGKSARGVVPSAPPKPVPYDYTLREELVVLALGLGAFLGFRGLYDIPILLAMAMAAITAYAILKLSRLIRTPNVRFQNLLLKRGGRLTRTGSVFAVLAVVWTGITVHSAIVNYLLHRGGSTFDELSRGADVWTPGPPWSQTASEEQGNQLASAISSLEAGNRLALLPTYQPLVELVWLYIASGQSEAAEASARRMIRLRPREAYGYRALANVYLKNRRLVEAERHYRKALEVDPTDNDSRRDLGNLLLGLGRLDDADKTYRAAIEADPGETDWPLALAELLLSRNRLGEAKDVIDAAVVEFGDDPRMHYGIGMLLVRNGQAAAAVTHFDTVIRLDPTIADAHFHLGVAKFMLGRLGEAEAHVLDAIALAPSDTHLTRFLQEELRPALARDRHRGDK